MARYAVAADLLQRAPAYLQTALLDDSGVGTATAGLAEVILVAACDELDGYLQAAGWSVPVAAPIPPMVKGLAIDIWWYRAHDRINQVDERVQRNWETTLERLKSIQRREVYPGLDPAPTERASIVDATICTSSTKLFGRSNLSGL